MKILYIGYYRDGTGWANAAQDYILSLDAAGINVVPRFLKLNERQCQIPKRIEELESQSDKNCDIVIQHVLPNQLDFNGSFEKNICIYVTETSHCKNTCWPERINLMDEAWVPNHYMAEESRDNNNIFIPHHIVPHASSMDKYQKEYRNIQIPELENKFVFYYIGEINRRKNLSSFIKAFHLEFSPEENVGIVIKGHTPGQSSAFAENSLSELCCKIKDGLKLYQDRESYHKEVFICDYLTDEQIMEIHYSFDCFVSASFGEAWGIPIFDAMAMGKTPICTSTSGPNDFLKDCGYLVESRKEPCFGGVDTMNELYKGNEYWDSININELRKSMRSAFENEEERSKKSEKGIDEAYKYSHESVGIKMKNILEGKVEPFVNEKIKDNILLQK